MAELTTDCRYEIAYKLFLYLMRTHGADRLLGPLDRSIPKIAAKIQVPAEKLKSFLQPILLEYFE